jgi:Flp pilus assembly protein TadB
MFGLEAILPNWLAALILGVLLVICAAIGIAVGQRRLKTIRAPRKTNNRQGELGMDQRTARIVKDIAEDRQRLGDNIAELERKLRQAADWRSYYARNPWTCWELLSGLDFSLPGF